MESIIFYGSIILGIAALIGIIVNGIQAIVRMDDKWNN